MKLYTEEQIIEALNKTMDSSKIWSYNDIINSLTPIELPTEEEIENNGIGAYYGFMSGVQYVLDHITSQINQQQ